MTVSVVISLFFKYFQTAAVAPVEDPAPALTVGAPTAARIVLRNNKQTQEEHF